VSSEAPPILAVCALRVAERLTPAPRRAEWRALWRSRLENLWILEARGELPVHAPSATARLCADAAASAFWLRFERGQLRQWLRGPAPILTLSAMAPLAVAVFSRGLQATRSVIHTALEWSIQPRALGYDPRADLVVATVLPIVFALTVGAVLIAIGRLSVGRYGWRYWLFLLGKLAAVMVTVPLIWIEGNAALRAHLLHGDLTLLFGWLAWTLAFFGAFGCGVVWAFTDQRRRCPVCLGRLAMPVTLGSWASVFEPVTTEMLCHEGHGSLSVDESEIGAGDRWIALDSSWRGL